MIRNFKLILSLIFVFYLGVAQATVYYVTPTGTGNGLSSGTPMNNDRFADALNNAVAGDVFNLAPGTYIPKYKYNIDRAAQTNARFATFYINKGVSIRKWEAQGTGSVILSGDLGVKNTITDNSYHVVVIAKGLVYDQYILDGITISDGYGNGGGSNSWGGGVFVHQNAKVKFKDLKVENNQTNSHGCGMFIYNNAEVIIDGENSFTNNTRIGASDVWGGAIGMWDNSKLTIMDGTAKFESNSANHGGAIHTQNAIAYISNAEFNYNTSFAHGGAINTYQSKAYLYLKNVNFTGNKCLSGEGYGGAIYTESSSNLTYNQGILRGNEAKHGGAIHTGGGTTSLSNLVVENNKASVHAGGINFWTGTATLDSCAIRNNTVTGYGGGIFNEGGELTLRRSEISGNKATGTSGCGGGILMWGKVKMTNTTVSRNHADLGGGGVWVYATTAEIINSTIVFNTTKAGAAGGIHFDSPLSIHNSIITGSDIPFNKNLEDGRAFNNLIDKSFYPRGSKSPQSGVYFDINTHLDPNLADNGCMYSKTHALKGSNNPAYSLGSGFVLNDPDITLQYDQRGIKRQSPPSIGAYEGKEAFPIANNDYVTIYNLDPFTIDVLANDFIPNTCTPTLVISSNSNYQKQGTAILDMVGGKSHIRYTPKPTFSGRDSVEYYFTCTGTQYSAKLYITYNNFPDNIVEAACFVSPQGGKWSIKEAWISTYDMVESCRPWYVGDLDGDGIPEIIALSTEGKSTISDDGDKFNKLVVFPGVDRDNPKFINTKYFGGYYFISSFGIARANNKGLIVVQGADGYLYAYDYNTTTGPDNYLWRTKIMSGAEIRKESYTIGFADFNNDGKPEVYAGNKIFDAKNGTLLCSGTKNIGFSIQNSDTFGGSLSVAVDIDSDGKLELVAGNNVYKVTENNGTWGMSILRETAPPELSSGTPIINDGHVSIADFNKDEHPDILVSLVQKVGVKYYSILYGWDAFNNKLLFRTEFESANRSIPFIGDINGDGKLEIITLFNTKLRAYTLPATFGPTQNLKLLWELTVDENAGRTGITLFDFDQDGKTELVYRDQANLRIIDGSKQIPTDLKSFPSTSLTTWEYPIVADIDNDGMAEIVVVGGTPKGKMSIFKPDIANGGSPWAPARKVWNQYAYNAVNVNNDLTIPKIQFNPATPLPGIDGVLRTTDDVYPYNAFLQQQTTLSVNGTPMWLAPNVWIKDNPSYHYYAGGDSLVIEVPIENIGDASMLSPVCITIYKNQALASNKLLTKCFPKAIAPGATETFSLHLENASKYAGQDLVVRINDDGSVFPVQAVCETTGSDVITPFGSFPFAQNDTVLIYENSNIVIDVLQNDYTGGCFMVSPSIITNAKQGTAVVVGDRIHYIPTANTVGRDTILYRIVCGSSSSEAYVFINIANIPDNIVDPNTCVAPMVPIKFEIKEQWRGGETHSNTGPLVGDLDGDGLPEIIAFTTDLKGIKVYNGQTGELKATLTIPPSGGTGGWYAVMTALLADADRNGKGEIIVAMSDKSIMSYEVNVVSNVLTLNKKWSSAPTFESPTTADPYPQPIITDFNGDGIPEIVVFNKIYNAVTGAYLGQTEPITSAYVGRVPARTGNQATNFISVADMDGDGLPEIIAGGKVYKIKFNSNNTAVTCSKLYEDVTIGDGFTAVADLNMDGKLDVAIVNVTGYDTWLHIWSPQTNTLIQKIKVYSTTATLNYAAQSFPFIGDIDGYVDQITGKKYPEICINTRDGASAGKVIAYKYNSASNQYSIKWELPTSDVSGGTAITLFDFNNDGINELVYRDQSHLRIINGVADNSVPILADASAIIPCISGTALEFPVIADTDGDGSANICVTCSQGYGIAPHWLSVFESANTPWAPTRKVWNQVNYNPLQINENLTVPKRFAPNNIEINGNYPYNGVLIQVPIMDEEGNVVLLAADPRVNSIRAIQYDETTIRVLVEIENIGNRHTNVNLPVSIYGNKTYTLPALDDKVIGVAIAPGKKQTIYFDIPLSTFKEWNGLSVRIQDDGLSFPVNGVFLDCNLDNNYKAVAISDLLILFDDGFSIPVNSKDNVLDVLLNDTLAGCNSTNITIEIAKAPSHGTINIANGKIEYTPAKDYLGPDDFEYRVLDCNSPQQIDTAKVLLKLDCPVFSGDIIYVKKGANGTGKSWSSPLGEVADAIKLARDIKLCNANKAMQIWVAEGTYSPKYTYVEENGFSLTHKDKSFILLKDVKMYGGFPSDANNIGHNLLESRNWHENKTILSGAINSGADSVYHVVIAAGDVGTAVLDGFIITGGKADGTESVKLNGEEISRTSGGGIYTASSSPILAHLTITENKAISLGGGLFLSHEAPKIFNSLVADNYSSNGVGGIFTILSKSELTNVTVSGNYGNKGGGIYNTQSQIVVRNSIVWGNTSSSSNQNMYDVATASTINNSLVGGVTSNTNNNIPGTTDPLFVDPYNPAIPQRNYRLKPGSPVWNKGSNTYISGYDFDLDHKQRVYHSIVDLGAYELQKFLLANTDYASSAGDPITVDVLANDSLNTCNQGSLTLFDTIPQSGLINGSLTINADSSFTYIPKKGFVGVDSVSYIIKCNTETSSAKVYFLVLKALSENYFACQGSNITLGLSSINEVVYNWYNLNTGGSSLKQGATFDVVKTTQAIDTWWVEPIWKGITFPRVPIYLETAMACGNDKPLNGCFTDGTILFRETFDSYDNGADPNSGIYSSVGLGTLRTSYKFFNGVLHPTNSASTAIYPHDGEYSLQKKNGGTHAWLFKDDHTTPNDATRGRAMLINANLDPGVFYTHNISGLCNNMRLAFSVWLANVNNSSLKPDLKFSIINLQDNSILAIYRTGSLPAPSGSVTPWKQYGFILDIPNGVNSIRLEITNNASGGSGNDFAMDDIEIRFCAPPVELKPNTDTTLICANANFKLEGSYMDDGTFGSDLEYIWMRRLKGNTIWENWGNKIKVSSPMVIDTTFRVSKGDEGYYRLVVSNPSNIGSPNCRAASDSIYLEVREGVTISDIRVKACSNPGTNLNLSKYLYEADYNAQKWSVKWKKVTGFSPTITNESQGTIDMNFGKNTHIYRYTVENECANGMAQLYIKGVDKNIVPPARVVVCKDFAENLQINQIFGLEGGTISASSEVNSYLTKVTAPSIYAGAIILDGKKAWEEINGIETINYNGDTQAKRVVLTYTVGANSCWPVGTKFALEVIITSVMIQ